MLDEFLLRLFSDAALYGFAKIDDKLQEETGCNCALVTCMPFPDLTIDYTPQEFYRISEQLRVAQGERMNEIKRFLATHNIKNVVPAASPKNDGNFKAEFSYKWAAVHAGLGFIGKNDVFVHYKFGQRVRLSCLLLKADVPYFRGTITSACGSCNLCVKACPHHCISGKQWDTSVLREELVDYKLCATKSRHNGEDPRYLCNFCMMACPRHKSLL